MEKFQYRACLAIPGGIQGTSRERLYDELALHSLVKRRWRNKLVFFYKIVNRLQPDYLYSYLDIPFSRKLFTKIIISLYYKTTSNKNKIIQRNIFPYCKNEWNKLRIGIRNVKSVNIFKKSIVSGKKENSLLCIYDPIGVKLLTRLRLQLGHGFSDTINPMFPCGTEVETTEHFLLRCQFYSTQRLELFEYIEKVEPNFLSLSAKNQVLILLHGSRTNHSENLNQAILKNVISFLKASTRFDRS